MHERPRRLTLAMIIFSALALLAFAACGGDDDDDSGGDNTATATRSGSASATDTGGDRTPEATDDGNNGDDQDILAQLEELGADVNSVTGRVSYNILDEDGSTTTMTFYSKPPNSRFDSTDSDGTTSIIISTPDTTYICDTSSETCFGTPGTGDDSSLGVFAAFFSPGVIQGYIQLADAAGVDVKKTDESIAGEDATCYSWDDNASEDISQGKFCFNDDGIMVYQEIAGADSTTKLAATDVSRDVSDSDFEPPYPVTTIPGQ